MPTEKINKVLCARMAEMARDVHELAIAKGWWQEPRSDIGLLQLINSELGEGTEALRTGAMSDKIRGFTGVEEEVADTVIRLLDMAQDRGIAPWEALPEIDEEIYAESSFVGVFSTYKAWLPLDDNMPVDELDILGVISSPLGIHMHYGYLYANSLMAHGYWHRMKESLTQNLSECLYLVFEACKVTGWRVAEAIVAKHEYNATRPMRHGGKLY